MADKLINKRILIVHRYFYPDTPTYAILLRKLSEFYSKILSSVHVLTAFPSYYGSNPEHVPAKEIMNGVRIKRLTLFHEHNRNFKIRILNSFLFSLKVLSHIIYHGKKKYDIIQVATTPPIIISGCVSIACKIRGLKFIYHCQDIYPEIINLTKTKSNLFTRLLFSLDKVIMKSADKVVVLSNDMKQYLVEGRKIEPGKIAVINNFTFNSEIPPKMELIKLEAIKEFCSSYEYVVVFAGNIGVFQDLDTICVEIEEVQKKLSLGLLVIGDGVEKEKLVHKFGTNKGIFFTGYIEQVYLPKIFKHCTVGIAPVIRGIEKVAFPSKIISYSIHGIPVLSFSEKESDIAHLVEGNNWGKNYNYEDGSNLGDVIISIVKQAYSRERIKEGARDLFSAKNAFKSWKKLLEEI